MGWYFLQVAFKAFACTYHNHDRFPPWTWVQLRKATSDICLRYRAHAKRREREDAFHRSTDSVKLKCEVGILTRLVDFLKFAAAARRKSPATSQMQRNPLRNCNSSFRLPSQIEREWETTLRNTFGVDMDEDDSSASGDAEKQKIRQKMAEAQTEEEEDTDMYGGSTAVDTTIVVPDVDVPPRRRRGSVVSTDSKKAGHVAAGKIMNRVSEEGGLPLGGLPYYFNETRMGSGASSRTDGSRSDLTFSAVREHPDEEGPRTRDRRMRLVSRPQALHLRGSAREARALQNYKV